MYAAEGVPGRRIDGGGVRSRRGGGAGVFGGRGAGASRAGVVWKPPRLF